MNLDNLPSILTPRQLSEALQISDQTIKKAIRAGRLDAFKVGRDWRIEKEAVLKWIEKGRQESDNRGRSNGETKS